ncbi:Peroxisomal (S)-2-hydroxy-acid oxidase GLO5 [Phytophthora citrophthora]|uniref:Peroxisomal (S)-2-hydroxy-acid oxidase GLO5 n=1 Tax=Phytophthora citrophthora TaxID=4793 RepID=A0AAD9GGE1_9STRA|nr:Peroxisomal (S)-2-hydroxy-acid oxidase GLO5 [Phytophthora citrophthora]
MFWLPKSRKSSRLQMATGGDAAALAASSINQEQLLHELESKYLNLKSEFSIAESERQALAADKKAALEEAERVTKFAAENEEETRQLKQQLLQVTTEKDALTFKLQTATSLAERRLTEVEELQATVREHNRLLVDAQRQEMQALERAAKQEAQVSEKTKTVQELRLDLSKHTRDLEELKMRSTEELTSAKRQLESARLANKKLESSLINSKEVLKELQASKVHDEEALQNELSAQRRLATLYKESAADASTRVTELQRLCDSLRKSLTDSEQALAHETERTKAEVEHLFLEQAESSQARIQALQDDLQNAEQKIKELEKKKIFSLQTASAVAELSSAAGEAHLAAHGLTPKQMYDHIVELEETLQAERSEKDKLQLYMDRIVKEVQEKAPVLMGLRLDHERTVASHTQLSERLEQVMHELAKSKSNEQHAWKEKTTFEKKCESLAQSVDDLSRQVQHLLFRSQDHNQQLGRFGSGDVGSENLVVFKDVEELQVRNQQLLTVIRELTEMNKSRSSEKMSSGASDVESTDSTAHLIITGDSDDELDQIGASNVIKKRLSMARKEVEELRTEREQEREMITAIVKQRDMYRVLLAQSDTKFLEGGAPSTQDSSAPAHRPQNRRGSIDIIENRKLREIQLEFEDYKKEKQANLKMLQETLDQERVKSSESRLAQMQAQVEATCNKERYEASEERCANTENELVRLRSKADQLSSLILQHQQMLANTEAKLEAANSRLQSLSVEKDSAVREADFLRKNEENIQQEMTTLRLDNTNVLKLMESTRRMETGREERDRREVDTLTKKVVTLETKLQDAYEKFDAKEVTAGAQVLAAEREKQIALADLVKIKEVQGQLKEQLARLEEQKTALESKSALLEKETTHLREQLRKGASAAAAERVSALEVQLRDAQLEVQASLVSRKALTDSVTKYKALAEVSEKNLAELSSASEKWRQSEAKKVEDLEKSRDHLSEELVKARAELKEHITENSTLREEIDRAEQTHKRSILEATEKQKMLQLQADSAIQQMNSVREEMGKMKRELETTQENYERELQLHASEVAKSSSSRREMDELRKSVREREADIEALNVKVESVEKGAQLQLETLQKRVDEAVEAKNAITEQNKLLHLQLERAATQVRRAHEQEMLKSASSSNQGAGEGAAAVSNAHEKEIDDLRSVVAYLRRESEIAESKLELSQQEVQRGRAQIFSLESTIERLRGEIKALSDAITAAGKQTSTTSADDEKRVAQLEQLSLLRESNATLRDENHKSLAKLKEEEAKVRDLKGKLVPLQNAEAALKTQVASLKQEVETLNDANKRWKQRVDQLVEKYQQVDPAEHDKVLAEKEALTKELAELKVEQSALKEELETLRSSGGKELEEEKKKVENWSKQYERIKGFAKNWKNKAETLTKQLAEKNKEVEDRASTIATLETKLSSVQAQISAVTAEKSALETKLAASEAAKQDNAAAASGANASWEKERQTLKAQLDLETKKSTQLKDFNARLMSGLKNLKKENSDLKGQKDHAANASQLTTTNEQTPVPSPPASPPQQSPSSTAATPPTKPATAPAPLFSLPKPVAKTEPVVQATATTSETKPLVSKPGFATLTTTPAISSHQLISSTGTVATTVTTTTATAMANTASAVAAPTPSAIVSTPKPAVPVPAQVAPVAAAPTPPVPAPPAPTPPKEPPQSSVGESDGMTAEEKLRLFALRSIKKQVGGAARFTPIKAPAPPADAEAKAAAPSEIETKETTGQFKFGAGTGFGAFGSGGPSGLVFGKPGISLPVPSPTSPGAAHPPHLSLAGEDAPPEALRRSQRLARFAADGDAPTSAASASPGPGAGTASALTKRPLSGAVEGTSSVQKAAKTSEDQTTVTTVTTVTTTASEGKQEEDTPPTQADTTETQPAPPTHRMVSANQPDTQQISAMVKIAPGSDATPLNVLEFEEYAKEYLPKSTWDYFASGSDSMETLKENREAFKRLVLHPRVLRDVSKMDISTTLLGHRISSPVCVAPSSTHKMAHPDGEIASSSATAKADTCFVLSTMSTTTLEDVATASSASNVNALRWFQLYVFKDRQITLGLVRRAEKAGYKAIVLTVDAPVLGNREADVRNHFSIPKHLSMANFSPQNATTDYADYVSDLYDQTLSWKDVKWLKSVTKLPIVAKGILTPEDALMAVESGCKGILVSNHGARQLDGVAATIDALPAIVQAVGDRAEVYMDGGIRRGTDVFKALSLGARAVFIGRPVLFGLAHSGEAGVLSVLRILNNELKHAMLFSGTASLADIGPAYVRRGLSPLPSAL